MASKPDLTNQRPDRPALVALKRGEPKSAYFECVPGELNAAVVTVTGDGALWLHAPHACFTPAQGRALIESLELAVSVADGGTR